MHRQQHLFLSVYVDDYKMAGWKKSMPCMWKKLQDKFDLEVLVPMGGNAYLGCGQNDISPSMKIVRENSKPYREISEKESADGNTPPPEPDKKPISQKEVTAYQYSMTGHVEQCVDKYLELAKLEFKSLEPVPTPCVDDHQFQPGELEAKGASSSAAARIVFKALFAARMNRMDCLWTIYQLARQVT